MNILDLMTAGNEGSPTTAYRLLSTVCLSAFVLMVVAFAVPASAQSSAKLKIGVGKQKKETRSRISVRFVSVDEDSRCPVGVNCVWAGNAKVKIKIRRGSAAWKTAELNTGIEPKAIKLAGYEISIDALTPSPLADKPLDKKAYAATFIIRRL